MPTDGNAQSPRRRKMFAVAQQIGLKPDELRDLASYLLRRDITSSRQLDEEQVGRMLDAMEGFELVTALIAQRVAVVTSEA